ncbi:MAG: radical SAM protein [Candidatus Gracilibacteria bacterium]|jgi:radical SAM protein with 4Fe4S-binding SPASM domain
MPKFKPTPKLEGYFYSFEESKNARDNGRILAIRTETSLVCNLRCRYCCNRSGKPSSDEITFEKIIDVVNQAKDLGAKSVVVIGGGEPTIYPKFKELIKHIHSLGMVPVIFTNTQKMTKEMVKFLRKYNVTVITKLDSLDEKTQDYLTGVKGSFKKIHKGIQNLIDAGYADVKDSQKSKLGASFVVSKKNAHEIPAIWRFCRDRKIYPNLEMMVPKEKGVDNSDWLLSREEWKDLKSKLLEIDRNEYGYDWLPHTPHIGTGCFQVMHNLYITVKGFVRPCACTSNDFANIKDYSLKEINNLPFFQIARHIEKNLKGKCANCKHHSKCIGCRGLAYTQSRYIDGKDPVESLCAEDPSCFML